MKYIEIITAILGLMSIFSLAKNKSIGWWIGLIQVLLCCIVFYQSKLYYSFALHIFYVFLQFYGIFCWKNNKAIKYEACHMFISILAAIAINVLFAIYFKHQSAVDATIMMLSIYATILMAKKITTTWDMYIISDLFAIHLYMGKHLYYMSFMYFVYLLFCIYGYISWKKQVCS